MGEKPSLKNKAASFVVGLIKVLMDAGEEAAIVYATAAMPFLANPVGRWILKQLIGVLANVVEDVVIKGAIKVTIDIQTGLQKSAVINAGTRLNYLKGSTNVEAIEKAKRDLSKAWSNAIHWDGTVST